MFPKCQLARLRSHTLEVGVGQQVMGTILYYLVGFRRGHHRVNGCEFVCYGDDYFLFGRGPPLGSPPAPAAVPGVQPLITPTAAVIQSNSAILFLRLNAFPLG